ncbi:DUF1931 family protein [Leifsonia poae]|uniref:DUF1931 domain-containing protein n=1 Tax=Leifsonia poae TaxID=110933 RepID=A0A9W6HC86_9MICO|nr:DUF1931 family protein [Leifsonia poae]GLJ77232.1 hypothetical protein GCM10017584_28060 [Leifsonia poae]
MHLIGIAAFERFFSAAGLEIDKNDLRRFDDFISDKVADLVETAVGNAQASGRDVVEPQDLPITAGLRESIHAFGRVGETVSLDAILEQLGRRSTPALPLSDEATAELPQIAGGIGVALARSFRVLDESLKTPQPTHWDKATRIFGMLL